MTSEILNTRLNNARESDLADLLDELEQLKGITVAAHREFTVLGFLQLCQTDPVRGTREPIRAANFYAGSLLRTRIEKLPDGAVSDVVRELCTLFKVPHEVVVSRTVSVFLNEILNEKSKLRAPIRIRI